MTSIAIAPALPPALVLGRTAANMGRYRNALGKALAGIDRCRIAFLGDSITAGITNANWYLNSISVQMENAIAKRTVGIVSDGGGMPILNTGTADGRWGFVGAWVNVSNTLFRQTIAGGAASATYTSQRAGTVVDIFYPNLSNGPFTYNIDGAGAVLVTPTAASSWGRVVVAGLANTAHTIVITPTTVAVTWLTQVQVRNPSGLELLNYAVSGVPTSFWTGVATIFTPVNTAVNQAPHLTVIGSGTVDAINAIPIATYQANLATLIALLRAGGSDVALWFPPVAAYAPIAGSAARYEAACRGAADTADAPYIDVYGAIGGGMLNADGMADALNLHPTTPGNGVIAAMLTDALLAAA
jgi:lysophospholipase L1-like esterase